MFEMEFHDVVTCIFAFFVLFVMRSVIWDFHSRQVLTRAPRWYRQLFILTVMSFTISRRMLFGKRHGNWEQREDRHDSASDNGDGNSDSDSDSSNSSGSSDEGAPPNFDDDPKYSIDSPGRR